MKARVERVGDEIAVYLPASLADEVELAPTHAVDVSRVGHTLVIDPADSRPTLEDLVQGITEENRHPETDWGRPVGREVW